MNMDKQSSLEVFSTMPVKKAVIKNVVPAIMAMLMVLVYNLADTFFVGQTHDALQVAAVSLATPAFLIFMSLGTVFGIGGTSVISRAMGEGRMEYAKKVCSFCMWSCVVLGIGLSVLFWVFMEPILQMIGTSAGTKEFSRIYLGIVALSGPFVLISNCFSNVLRAEGQATKAMTGMLLGNFLNIVLDPIMILWLNWDILGAAVATVLGNVVGAGYYILYFLRGQSILSVRVKDFTLRDSVCTSVLAIGVPASLGSLLMSVSQIVMNSQMAIYGDMAVAGIGVAMKVTMITGMLSIGLGQGVQPLLGFCVGAKTWKRYHSIMRYSIKISLIMGLALTLICYLFTNQIVGAFLADKTAVDYGVEFARILLSTGALFGVFYVLINALQAMGAAISSLVINLSRQGLIYIPALFLLNSFFGIDGLAWTQPVADLLSICLAVFLYMSTVNKLEKCQISHQASKITLTDSDNK